MHWLPIYLGKRFVKHFFTNHSKVVEVRRVETKYGEARVKTGVIEVVLEVTENEKASIPHLVRFGCGTTCLLTVPWPSPLCLRCPSVGHMRRDCQNQGPSFSSVVKSRQGQRKCRVAEMGQHAAVVQEGTESQDMGSEEEPERVQETVYVFLLLYTHSSKLYSHGSVNNTVFQIFI